MTIVSTLDRAVDPDAVDRIARRLGVDAVTARDAVTATLPALLAMLSGKGSSVSGAGAIFDAVKEERRPRDLVSLLGENETGPLIQAVAGYNAIGRDRATDLLGILGPVVLDGLAGEIGRRHLDKTGLSRFLCDQQAAISEALPAGFARHVSGSRYFDTFRTGFASDTTAPMTATAFVDPALLAEEDYARTVRKPTAMRVGIALVMTMLAVAWLFYIVGDSPEPPASPSAGIERDAN